MRCAKIRDLVAKLDIHSPNETFRIHVYHLSYAPATEMVDVLNGLLSGGGGPSSLSPQTGRDSLGARQLAWALERFGLWQWRIWLGGFGGGGSFGGSGSVSAAAAVSAAASGGFGGELGRWAAAGQPAGVLSASGARQSGLRRLPATAGAATDFESPVSITADPATNSLVISAAPQDYETLQRVIDQLDIPRVQVFVQAIIVEVSVQHIQGYRRQLPERPTALGNTLGVGSLNFGNLQTALGNPLGLTGLGIGLASGNICSIPVNTQRGSSAALPTTRSTISVPCDVALMTALQCDTHSNVLSAPTLLTADNEEAMIVVGQNLPFVGSAAANAGLPGQIFNSVERQNVGITLDIVPQVSQGDYVKLDVYEEVSNVVPEHDQ